MSALIVYLPTTLPGAAGEYPYAQTRDGEDVLAYGSANASTLPAGDGGQDVVAVVPARALSWHQTELPKGTLGSGSTRVQAVLEGLLEDRLLDDAQQLHFALAPDAAPGKPVWVAACDKAWLQGVLAPLEAAGRPVSRIVPEFTPLTDRSGDAQDAALYAIGTPDEAWLVYRHTQGVTVLPLLQAAIDQMLGQRRPLPGEVVNESAASVLAAGSVMTEPAVAALANPLFHDRAVLQQAPARWVQAAQSDWDLAQFDLANSGRQRAYKKFSGYGLELLNAPRWRAARLGLAGALLVNLVGLNAWAWKEQAGLAQRRSDIQAVLTQTFTQVKVVIDAPVQMAREVAQLRQMAGAASRSDLENLLTAVGSTLPPKGGLDLTQLEFTEGELRLKGPGLTAEKAQDLSTRLAGPGYAARMDGDRLLVTPQAAPGARR